jgi:hypothetical protein
MPVNGRHRGRAFRASHEPPSRNGAIHNSHDKESRISRIRLMEVAR